MESGSRARGRRASLHSPWIDAPSPAHECGDDGFPEVRPTGAGTTGASTSSGAARPASGPTGAGTTASGWTSRVRSG
jgi:hypothetical protein